MKELTVLLKEDEKIHEMGTTFRKTESGLYVPEAPVIEAYRQTKMPTFPDPRYPKPIADRPRPNRPYSPMPGAPAVPCHPSLPHNLPTGDTPFPIQIWCKEYTRR